MPLRWFINSKFAKQGKLDFKGKGSWINILKLKEIGHDLFFL